jgi:hypothetical protein
MKNKANKVNNETYKIMLRCSLYKPMMNETKRLNTFLLRDKNFYSYSVNYVSENTNIPVDKLMKFSHDAKSFESTSFEHLTHDWINIFSYNNVEYIGLESERIRYEEDKLNGTNVVEDLIKMGFYDDLK